ncbi:hypothetical protein PR003_g11868 [Phytophthora rubi]|uniref:Uncharacterized protein n=1 Tax=Phytophthora rubi TaxID=129364 RepID=A0A6A4FK31_9STRA|nr:hypothetical protein PR003_g11868 [Phytophthora rubi]
MSWLHSYLTCLLYDFVYARAIGRRLGSVDSTNRVRKLRLELTITPLGTGSEQLRLGSNAIDYSCCIRTSRAPPLRGGGAIIYLRVYISRRYAAVLLLSTSVLILILAESRRCAAD